MSLRVVQRISCPCAMRWRLINPRVIALLTLLQSLLHCHSLPSIPLGHPRTYRMPLFLSLNDTHFSSPPISPHLPANQSPADTYLTTVKAAVKALGSLPPPDDEGLLNGAMAHAVWGNKLDAALHRKAKLDRLAKSSSSGSSKNDNAAFIESSQEPIAATVRHSATVAGQVGVLGDSDGTYTSSSDSNSTSSASSFLPSGDAVVQAAGPKCSGRCCSNKAAKVPKNVPAMVSRWMSSQLAHGAKVHLLSGTWQLWVGPAKGSKWGQTVGAFRKQPPPMALALTVERVAGNKVRFRTSANTYLRAGKVYASVDPKYPTIDISSSAVDPATIFTVTQVAGQSAAALVTLQARDGLFVSAVSGGKLMRWATKASSWEQFSVFEAMAVPKIRGVNLGGWLVYERWMNPGAYPDPAKWKDGTVFTAKSMANSLYLSAPLQGTGSVISSLSNGSIAGSFHLVSAGKSTFYIRTQSLYYWQVPGGTLSATAGRPALATAFKISFRHGSHRGSGFALLQVASGGRSGNYLRVTSSGAVVADVPASSIASQGTKVWTGASGFYLYITSTLDGEWQMNAAFGSSAAAHRTSVISNFIRESDWKWMRKQGLNTVRIPIGYWVAQDPRPEYPFVPGASSFLDRAFAFGAKYSIRIWLSMHVAPGTQSGSVGSRDAFALWSTSSSYYKQTLTTITWIARRYGRHPAWLGMGLMNEPILGGVYGSMPGVSLSTLTRYYTDAYAIIRTYAPCAWIAMESRVGKPTWEVYYHMLDNYHTNLVVEKHYYTVFDDAFKNMPPAQEVASVRKMFAADVAAYEALGRPVLVGEWSAAMTTASPTYYRAFAQAQLQAFSKSGIGWFFWSLKNNVTNNDAWSYIGSKKRGWL